MRRYDFFLDCMCLTGTPTMSEKEMQKILFLVARGQVHSKRSENKPLLETVRQCFTLIFETPCIFHKYKLVEFSFNNHLYFVLYLHFPSS